MKLLKGDIIKFTYGGSLLTGRVTGETTRDDEFVRNEVIILDADGRDSYIFDVKVDEKFLIPIYNYEVRLFSSHLNHIDKERITIIRPGWLRRQQRPFLKRLKYLFLNRF